MAEDEDTPYFDYHHLKSIHEVSKKLKVPRGFFFKKKLNKYK